MLVVAEILEPIGNFFFGPLTSEIINRSKLFTEIIILNSNIGVPARAF
jgi:hypothetical protein